MLWWIAQNAFVSALLAAVAAALCRVGRFSPAMRHAFWLVVLVKLVTPPFASYGVPQRVDNLLTKTLGSMLSAEDGEPVGWPSEWYVRRPLVADVPADDTANFAAAHSRATNALSPPADVDDPAAQIVPAREHEAASSLPPLTLAAGYFGDSPVETALGRLWLVWLLGAVVFATVQAIRIAGLWRLVRQRVRQSEPAWLKQLVQEVAARLHVRPPEVVVISARCSPLVCALGRPRLLWPAALEHQLGHEAREAVLLHELAHLRRRDHWVAWLELFAGVIWWFNPVYWYARHQLRETAEVACDAWAIAFSPAGRRAYSEALLEVIEFVSAVPAAFPAMAMGNVARSSLERRLTMILRERMSHRVPFVGTALIGLALLAVLPSWSRGQQFSPDAQKPTDAQKPFDAQKPADAGKPVDPLAEIPKGPIDAAPVDPLGEAGKALQPLDGQKPALVLADASDADREARIRQVEAKLAALLAEVQALRAGGDAAAADAKRTTGTIGADMGNVALPPRQETVPFVPASKSWWIRRSQPAAGNHKAEVLTRVRYELVEPAADKLAELLSLKSKVVASSKAGIIEVVASPEDQATIGAFIELLNKHEARPAGEAEMKR